MVSIHLKDLGQSRFKYPFPCLEEYAYIRQTTYTNLDLGNTAGLAETDRGHLMTH